MPFVLIDSDRHKGAPHVEVDDRGGAHEAARHLLELGHRRLAVLSIGPGPGPAARGYQGPLARRLAGIRDAFADAGLTMDDVPLAEVPATRAEGYRATKELMSGPATPTAILALSDVLAYGAVDALRELGAGVPGDVSVTGFDDLAESAWLRPGLTTVRQPIVTKGRMAADFLISAIRGEDQHPHQTLGTSLIIRESTAKPA
ncbi:substrate-binding domain-containing protein [Actinoplanes regularis]|uniref:substrate-binding domain-containing protein n=1 Tax=Actinoplanes regularis TaxID=52697 RepID=UPI0023B2452C|nr:substrate-binding domain-containing protein [Actinoplanes regularis]